MKSEEDTNLVLALIYEAGKATAHLVAMQCEKEGLFYSAVKNRIEIAPTDQSSVKHYRAAQYDLDPSCIISVSLQGNDKESFSSLEEMIKKKKSEGIELVERLHFI